MDIFNCTTNLSTHFDKIRHRILTKIVWISRFLDRLIFNRASFVLGHKRTYLSIANPSTNFIKILYGIFAIEVGNFPFSHID